MIGTILQQLLNTENNGADIKDPAARRFYRRFKERREDVVDKYFKLFNRTIFDNKLPVDLEIEWKNRLLKTAGFCIQENIDDRREAHIELASKVCDTPERIRDVLVHELCHAASWLIDGVRDCHGPGWRYWADKANKTHPEIPPVSPYHEYSITTKTGRHSKSVDIDNYVCGHCDGRIQLLRVRHGKKARPISHNPREPSSFALFLRENYRKVKRRNKELSSSEIMKQLSEEFARKNKSKGDGKGDNFRKQKKRKRSEELSGGDVTVGLRSQAAGSEVEIEVDSSEDDFA
ncbi:hypothetical protein BaRGS_00040344 [Batillaria attramentaria]|uniref:SprT-like domain-containing protein n=1 Tax=Batillaria attramentaria TaxID=370345 RepID=A0ABD0J0I1_9CAEN